MSGNNCSATIKATPHLPAKAMMTEAFGTFIARGGKEKRREIR